MNIFAQTRYDCFVVWGHGVQYLSEILDDIRACNEFEIVCIKRIVPSNVKKMIHEIYSYDYAPLVHLKGKIKYLESTPREIYFVFVKNINVSEDFFGKGNFRHKECLNVNRFKNMIRSKFNPRKQNGEISHDHVIHATDNESQTDSMLKMIGYSDGVRYLYGGKKIINSPHYIGEPDILLIKKIDISDIYCVNAFLEAGAVTKKMIPIGESVQYRGIVNPQTYFEYVNRFRGTVLTQDYDVDKYINMTRDFEYLGGSHSSSFVIVKESYDCGKYIVVDGLHRAAIHLNQGHKDLMVCVI